VADHPLRPATDRRLGEPLPHQLANRTRANPSAINLSPSRGLSGISSSFPELFRTKGHVPTRYSPVCHSRIAASVRLACVKPAASVRSEPGSNSQVQERRSHDRSRASRSRLLLKEDRIDGVHIRSIRPDMSSKRVTVEVLPILAEHPKANHENRARTPPSAFLFLSLRLSNSNIFRCRRTAKPSRSTLAAAKKQTPYPKQTIDPTLRSGVKRLQ
jgi:hypothetical protein